MMNPDVVKFIRNAFKSSLSHIILTSNLNLTLLLFSKPIQKSDYFTPKFKLATGGSLNTE
jgi:hypothetical protein